MPDLARRPLRSFGLAQKPGGARVKPGKGKKFASLPAAPVLHDLSPGHAVEGRAAELVGVGGVASGAQAYAKIRAGAALVQLYTGFAYGGPAVVPRIKRELAALLARDGVARVGDAVGADA